MDNVQFSVFTKPWKKIPVPQLAEFVKGLGFDGIEFPLRDGYQVNPDNAENGLPELVSHLADYGIRVFSVASSPDEQVFAGCALAGVPMIRIMINIGDDGYIASEQREMKRLERLVPLCERYGVKIGIQQHYGNCVSDASGLRHLVSQFNSEYIGAIWDAAHDALAGQQPEYGLDIVWNHLCMVNLKNAFYMRANGPEAEVADWQRYFTTGKHGLASWPRIASYLIRRNYRGVVCLTAEYTDEQATERLIREDIQYAKSLFQ
ncbi:sugar phosphate isomerase/epimerase [Alicyclobacillus fastidiosus]|uniref:Sugar phosphate isomerase/epimerase n=1 Tax=Alicyclobacillus fastidiosus TaxID=392011 RepID=A0ABY6ZBB4_9BACL|nr:TIM barrel protein [Alicyclobacillus fastidiosus]WAH39832.1 sugar phosphate isomerase/epimerase [Alicyclobacillus fastidiosus]